VLRESSAQLLSVNELCRDVDRGPLSNVGCIELERVAVHRATAHSLSREHQFGIFWVMPRAAVVVPDPPIARTIRFPAALRDRLVADAGRCGRSFEGQVIALLRRHYGEDVDIAPSPTDILALATASLAGVPASDQRLLTRKLKETER
jgi:hypothetical protein